MPIIGNAHFIPLVVNQPVGNKLLCPLYMIVIDQNQRIRGVNGGDKKIKQKMEENRMQILASKFGNLKCIVILLHYDDKPTEKQITTMV